MNIVFLLGGYLLLFLFCVSAYFVCWRQSNPLLHRAVEGLSRHSPTWVFRLYTWVFEKRNPVIQLMYGAMVLAGHAVVFMDMLPHLMVLDRGTDYIHPPLALWAINTVLYIMCSQVDPGIVHGREGSQADPAEGQAAAGTGYCFDDIIYKPNNVCVTCKVVKPARSKHCRVCNVCVARFDHHCVWTNSCIGARNHKHFLLLLASLVVMCANAAYMCIRTLYLIALHRGLFAYRYRNPDTGESQPVTGLILVQYLFMEYPRVFFLGSSMVVLVLLVGVFLLFHLYLMCCNITTNEFYKYNAASASAVQQSRAHYDRGVIRNVLEVFSDARGITHCRHGDLRRRSASIGPAAAPVAATAAEKTRDVGAQRRTPAKHR